MLCLTLQKLGSIFTMNELSSIQNGHSKKYEFTLKDDQCIFLLSQNDKISLRLETKGGGIHDLVLKSIIKFEEVDIHNHIKNPIYSNQSFWEIKLKDGYTFRMKCVPHNKNTYVCTMPTIEFN